MKGIYALIIIALLASCKTTKNSKKNTILKGNYKVVEMKDMENLEVNPTIKFDSKTKKVSGVAGCNSYGGDYVIKDNKITFSILYKTEMYCDMMAIEKLFFKNLSKVSNFLIEKEKLLLLDDSNSILMELVRLE